MQKRNDEALLAEWLKSVEDRAKMISKKKGGVL